MVAKILASSLFTIQRIFLPACQNFASKTMIKVLACQNLVGQMLEQIKQAKSIK
jgi:hypothetical protein